jgi:hypothetical protein
MTAIRDPYPETLEDVEFSPPTLPAIDPQVVALNRIATALEQLTLAVLDRPQVPQAATARPALAPLPPVQVVADKPSCTKHGPDKVAPSNKFAGFYCTAKDPQGPRGFCGWQFRT